MIYHLLVATTLVLCSSAAPLQHEKSENEISRTKRSEEAILYGNHQNFARMKKGNLHPLPFPSHKAEKVKSDKSSTKEEDKDKQDAQGKVSTKVNGEGHESLEQQKERIEQILASNLDIVDEKEEQIPIEKEKSMEEHETEEENEAEKTLEHIAEEAKLADTLDGVHSDGLSISDPAKITEEYKIVEKTPVRQEDMTSNAQGRGVEYNWGDYYEDRQNDDNAKKGKDANENNRNKRSSVSESADGSKSRAIRSAHMAVRAEDMGMSSKLGGRVKRDLDFSRDDYDSYADGAYYGPERDFDEYPEVDESMLMERRSDDQENWTDEDLDNYLQEPNYNLDPSFDPSYELQEGPVSIDDIIPEERRKLELLRYLYNQREAMEGGEGDYPEDLDESWQDLAPAREAGYGGDSYEPYQEENLSSYPNKRQFLSFVPGNRKRDNGMFYPAQYGPDGRWGAFVADPQVEKRNELAEYERLYELAQALNGEEGQRMAKREKGIFVPMESLDEYWSRRRRR